MIDQKTAPYAALILRLATGALFIAHGLYKVFVATIPGIMGYFESLGLPGFLVYIVILAEVIGGSALILGVATRLVSVGLTALLMGVVWAHAGAGWMVTGASAGWEFPALWLAAQATLALLGSGAWALKLPVLERRLGAFA